ncbi:MAG: hypothetical protein K8R53_04825 [Bacteroidales bacterium]|nr:hypothetical protein [Bacteroidales bacterium]
MKTFSIILLMLISVSGFSQKKNKKPYFENRDKIISTAILELDYAMRGPEGELYLFAEEFYITGEYTFDISIREKGTVASVFVAGREGGNIPSQNKLKDRIKDFRFNFKMPKGKSFKFQYIFKFE